MTYEQAVRYLSSLSLYGVRMGNARMRELLRRLGNPQESVRVVHVTGTNGKGSTATFLSFILRAAGFKTGTYLSPYVFDLRERVQVNGDLISETDFTRWIETCRPLIERLRDTEYGQVTEFELKTALAYAYFAEQAVQFAVMEVGLGGRLDATNVMIPEVSVITGIGLDHVHRLGPTHADIAYEKGMIIKPGRPVVSAALHPDARAMIRRLVEVRGAELTEVVPFPAGESRLEAWAATVQVGEARVGILNPLPFQTGKQAKEPPDAVHHADKTTERGNRPLEYHFTPRLPGHYQASNAACAVAVSLALRSREFPIPDEAMRQGIGEAWLPGRMQVVCQEPLVVLDGAHNAEAAQALAASLPQAFRYQRLILVFGMLKPHDPAAVLKHLLPLAHRVILTCPPSQRAESPEELAKALPAHVPFTVQANPLQAFHQALSESDKEDLVLVTGSFYLIGEWKHMHP